MSCQAKIITFFMNNDEGSWPSGRITIYCINVCKLVSSLLVHRNHFRLFLIPRKLFVYIPLKLLSDQTFPLLKSSCFCRYRTYLLKLIIFPHTNNMVSFQHHSIPKHIGGNISAPFWQERLKHSAGSVLQCEFSILSIQTLHSTWRLCEGLQEFPQFSLIMWWLLDLIKNISVHTNCILICPNVFST